MSNGIFIHLKLEAMQAGVSFSLLGPFQEGLLGEFTIHNLVTDILSASYEYRLFGGGFLNGNGYYRHDKMLVP